MGEGLAGGPISSTSEGRRVMQYKDDLLEKLGVTVGTQGYTGISKGDFTKRERQTYRTENGAIMHLLT